MEKEKLQSGLRVWFQIWLDHQKEMIERKFLPLRTGEADIAVANTYYLALMLSVKKGAEQQAGKKSKTILSKSRW